LSCPSNAIASKNLAKLTSTSNNLPLTNLGFDHKLALGVWYGRNPWHFPDKAIETSRRRVDEMKYVSQQQHKQQRCNFVMIRADCTNCCWAHLFVKS
jgi:hypothetical protein